MKGGCVRGGRVEGGHVGGSGNWEVGPKNWW